MEGDAFGAGLLQHFVDRGARKDGPNANERELAEVVSVRPEDAPLIIKSRGEAEDGPPARLKVEESVM